MREGPSEREAARHVQGIPRKRPDSKTNKGEEDDARWRMRRRKTAQEECMRTARVRTRVTQHTVEATRLSEPTLREYLTPVQCTHQKQAIRGEQRGSRRAGKG